jgi:hypothetical protein
MLARTRRESRAMIADVFTDAGSLSAYTEETWIESKSYDNALKRSESKAVAVAAKGIQKRFGRTPRSVFWQNWRKACDAGESLREWAWVGRPSSNGFQKRTNGNQRSYFGGYR